MKTFTKVAKAMLLAVSLTFAVSFPAFAQTSWTGDMTFSSNQTINGNVICPNDINVTVASGVTITITGDLSIEDHFTKKGAGTLIVSHQVNGYDGVGGNGELNIAAGRLQVGNNTNNNPQIRRMENVFTTGGTLVVSCSGTVNLWESQNDDNSAFFYDIATTRTGSIGNYQYMANWSFNSGGIAFNGSGTMNYKPISGSYTSANNRFGFSPDCGYVHVEQGTLQVNADVTTPVMTVPLKVLAGALISFNIVNTVLPVPQQVWTYNQQIDGDGTVKKAGPATLILGYNHANFTGTLDINEGTLQFSTGYMDRAKVKFSGNTAKMDISAGNRQFYSITTQSSSITNAEIILGSRSLGIGNDASYPGSAQSGGGTYTGKITGTGKVTKRGNTILTLTGASTYSGGTEIYQGAIEFSAADNFGTGNITISNAYLRWANGNTTDISPRILAESSAYLVGLDIQNNNVTFSAAIPNMSDKQLSKYGSGTLAFTADMTVDALSIVGTISMGAGGANGFISAQYINLGIRSSSHPLLGYSDEQGILRFNLSSDRTFANTIGMYSDGPFSYGTLEKAGGGKITMTGNWQARCGEPSERIMNITGGTLEFHTLPTSYDINVGSGAKLVINNSEDCEYRYSGWVGPGGDEDDPNTWTFSQHAGKITGSGSVEKTGAGTLTFYNNGIQPCTGQFIHTSGKVIMNKGWAGKYLQASGATLELGGSSQEVITFGSMQLNGGGYLEGFSLNKNGSGSNRKIKIDGTFSASGVTTIISPVSGSGNNLPEFTLMEAGNGINSTAYFSLNLPEYPQANLRTDGDTKLILALGTTYTITASAGTNGSITPNGAIYINQGANRNFTFTANSGYMVDRLLIDGTNVPDSIAGGSYTFVNVTANHTIEATFKVIPPNTHLIRATAGANGTISPSGVILVSQGTDQAFTFTSNSGYKVEEVLVDNVSNPSAIADGSYTFVNVTTEHTIEVRFAPTTGIVETQGIASLQVYPNPVQNTLYLQSSSAVEQISIYDISGRMLKQIANPSQEINVSNLAKGTYLVKVKTLAGEVTRTIIKE